MKQLLSRLSAAGTLIIVEAAVIPLRPRALEVDDPALVAALQAGIAQARAELFDRYGRLVQRVIVNVLGLDSEVEDLVHEVFVRALRQIHTLRDGDKLKAWLTSIAVFTARGCIRARSRRRWLPLTAASERAPRAAAPAVPEHLREALRCTYEVLDRLGTTERIVFTLRHIHGMELTEIAQSCEVSLATVKRRLRRAQQRFLLLARHRPALDPWLKEGTGWTRQS